MPTKEIKINPELFNLSGKKKKKEKSKKVKPLINIKPNTIKRDLLKRIKARKNISNKDTYNSSVELFKEIKENPKTQKPEVKNETNIFNQSMIKLPTSPSLYDSTTPLISPTSSQISYEEPPYSNLKNGSKPTYKEWKNVTQKRPHPVVLTDKPKEKFAGKIPTKKQIKHYTKFGKKNKTISILIKDRATRKKIDTEIKTLKTHEISKIKEYLRDRGLIKVGTHAPDDVLRETYENAYLTGEVVNVGKENLLHNFMNEES